jgi:cobalt-zinc-cadmium efflux system outer membrane protein
VNPPVRTIRCFLGLSLLGATLSARDLTLDQAVDRALSDNSTLAATQFEIGKAEGRAIQAGLAKNPELEIGTSSNFEFRRSGDRGVSLELTQAFARKDRLQKARAAANLSVEQQRALIRDAERLLIGDVEVLFLNVLTLDQQYLVHQRTLEIGTRLLTIVDERFRQGLVPQTDIAPVRIENAKLVQEQELALAAKVDAELKLKLLLGLPPEEPITLRGSVEEIVSRFSANPSATVIPQRPDIAAADLAIRQADAEIEMARAEAHEDISVGISYESEFPLIDTPFGAKDERFLGIKLTIPLPVRNKNQGRILEQQAARRQAGAQVDTVRQRAVSEFAQAQAAAQRLGPIVGRYRDDLIPLAEQNFQAVQRAYEQGLISITNVFQAQQQRLSLEMDYLTHLSSWIGALITLETAAGTHPRLRQPENNRTPSQP